MTSSQKKRILLVTRNFPPLTGGMERLNYHIYLELKKEFDVCIAGPEGCQHYLEPYTPYHTFPHKPLSVFLFKSLITTYILSVKEKPNVVIAGSGVTSIAALIIGKLTGAKTIVFLHGLDVLFPNIIYQLIFIPAIKSCNAILANSYYTKLLALQKNIKNEKINVLHPGVALPNKYELNINNTLFKIKFSIPTHKKIILSVGRLTERKGLPEFIKNCLPELITKQPDILLVILGAEPTQALSKQSGILAKIEQTISQCNVKNHVLLLGHIPDDELFQAYAGSELLIFPVLDLPGDVEGFGMVAIEAAAYGLPTVAFAVGGITDAVSHNYSGWLVNSGDYTKLSIIIINYLTQNNNEFNVTNCVSRLNCQHHAAKFSWDLFGHKLRPICHKMIVAT